jgi:hypothetical protein
MKRNMFIVSALLLAGSLLAADSDKETVKAAIKKTASAGYAWKAPTREGKADKDGTVYIRETRRNRVVEIFIKGEKVAIKPRAVWRTLAEVQAAAGENNGATGTGGGRFAMYNDFKSPAIRVDELLDHLANLKSSDGAVSGDLTDEAVNALVTLDDNSIAFRGSLDEHLDFKLPKPEGNGAVVTNGCVRFWIKDGALAKVECQIRGVVTKETDKTAVDITDAIEFTDIGTTAVSPPDEAAEKLR